MESWRILVLTLAAFALLVDQIRISILQRRIKRLEEEKALLEAGNLVRILYGDEEMIPSDPPESTTSTHLH